MLEWFSRRDCKSFQSKQAFHKCTKEIGCVSFVRKSMKLFITYAIVVVDPTVHRVSKT